MSVLWLASLLFLAAGAVVVTATLRKSAEATIALRDECARLDELRSALVDLRRQADLSRSTVDRIRARGERDSVDR